MAHFFRNHITFNNRTEVLPYTSNQSGRTKIIPRSGLDRQLHGDRLRVEFNQAVNNFRPDFDSEFVYLVFKSPLNFLLDLEKLNKSDCALCSYKILESNEPEGGAFYEAIVRLNKKAISRFLIKIDNYIQLNTPKGNPQNQSLIANIDEIRNATLESFWQEPGTPFPNTDTVLWWEIWINANENEPDPLTEYYQIFKEAKIEINNDVLIFPEHRIYLLRASADQLAITLLYTDCLAEIRKPRDTAEFFTYLDKDDQNEWIEELVARTTNNAPAHNVSVCLLDTGFTIANPLFANIVEEKI